MTGKIIDFDHIRLYVGEDVGLTKEVLGLFKNQVDMWSRGLDAEAGDEAWLAVMHSLKGSARAVGAMRLAGLCEHGETLVQERGGVILRQANIEEIHFAIDEVLIEISRWEYKQTMDALRS